MHMNVVPALATASAVIDHVDSLKARLDRIPDELAATVPAEHRETVRAAVQQHIDRLNADVDAELVRLLEQNVIRPQTN